MPIKKVNDIEMYYEEYGKGEPVMLITGLGGVGAGWGPQIPLFAQKYRTIVPDHRGAGRTTKATRGYTIEEHARDMAELLHELGAAPAHLVGSSTGGAISMVMARNHPETVRSLTLTSTWGRSDSYFKRLFNLRKQTLQQLGQQAAVEQTMLLSFSPAYLRANWEMLQKLEKHLLNEPIDIPIQLARMDMVIAHDVLDQLPTIEVPATIMVGEQDIVTPPYFSEELMQYLKNAQLHMIPHAGHSVFAEQPEKYFQIADHFISTAGC